MKMELNGLIDKIKKEGIEEADKKSKDIIQKAQEKAQGIIAEAEAKRKNILQDAEQEVLKLKQQAEDSIKQSIRDMLLMLKQRIVDVFDTVLQKEITENMKTSVIEECIIKIIENFKKEESLDIEILLGQKDREKLEKAILDKFTTQVRKGITIKVSKDIETGFRIGKKGENYYYDFTDEAIAESLKQYLNPKLIKILDKDKKNA